jgi:hypothetical protein
MVSCKGYTRSEHAVLWMCCLDADVDKVTTRFFRLAYASP